MTIQQLRYFLALAQELHFWKTSEKMYLSQSTLSRQILSLEEELGCKLFERDKRNVKLTDAGRYLQEKWTVLIDEFDRTVQQAKKIDLGTTGAVSISYPGSIIHNFLPEVLELFSRDLPEVKIELMEPVDKDQERLLLDYKIDISFSRDSTLHPSLLCEKLYTELVCLVVPKQHWLTQDTFENLRDLKDEKFITSGLHHNTYFASLLRQMFSSAAIEPEIQIETDFGGIILNLVSQNLGVSILPMSFSKAENENLRFIPLEETVDLYVHWRKNDPNRILEQLVVYAKELGAKYALKSKR
ncbi:LysR family transcriptional regulator [Galbibacter marinus]|uniref:LysR family transcriptional regulator n=1 Tax=Galbibacter marinus TaxID=555500 RepID=K2P3B0_9FLAO|nr:LysR substrate-binding domain-containing protein [Galbibacter marinus]EKF55543.1 LysR family transcriptional regulator [Galbibacter marinus]